MERDIHVKRLYFLGNYKNVEFSNTLKGIPEELASNDKVVGLLYVQQFIAIETAYRKYYQLVENLVGEETKKVLETLETERTQTMRELYEEINKIGEPQIVPQIKLEETQEKETE
jgi:uncharacterized protein YbjQ (UPF0145 family)